MCINNEDNSFPGNYTQSLVNVLGCDSILYISLLEGNSCSDCIFDTEFSLGNIDVMKISEDELNLSLVQNGISILSLTLTHDEFMLFSALYLVDNEIENHGKKSKLKEIFASVENIVETLSTCEWDATKRFTSSLVTSILPFSTAYLPKDFNVKKLDLLFKNILTQTKQLKVGANMKINLR